MPTDDLTRLRALLARVEELDEKATKELHHEYYHHGGGRVWKDGSDKQLVLDVYDEGNRAFYFESRTLLPILRSVLEEAINGLEDLSKGYLSLGRDRRESKNVLARAAALLPPQEGA